MWGEEEGEWNCGIRGQTSTNERMRRNGLDTQNGIIRKMMEDE